MAVGRWSLKKTPVLLFGYETGTKSVWKQPLTLVIASAYLPPCPALSLVKIPDTNVLSLNTPDLEKKGFKQSLLA